MGNNENEQIKDDKTCLQCPSNLEELEKILEVDDLPGTKEAQEILLRFAQQRLQEEGGREWLEQEKSDLLAQLSETERLSDEELEKIARKAKFNGFISLWDLAFILEAEENRDLLPVLWKEFECNSSGKEVEIDTPYKCAFGWFRWLARITGIGSWPPEGGSDRYWADPILGKLPRMQNFLKLYKQEPATGNYKEVDSIKDHDDSGFIKLKDLEEYLKTIEQTLGVKFPLPKRLFPGPELSTGIPVEEGDKASKEDISSVQNLIRKSGDFWDIAFQGSKIFHVKDTVGLKYIHFLLGRPNEPISAADLVQMGGREHPPNSIQYEAMTEDQLEEYGMRKASLDSPSKQRVSNEQAQARDEKTCAEYKFRLEEIERELQDPAADPEKRSYLNEEYRMISEELRKMEDQTTELSKIKSQINLRSAVTMAIDRAIRQISEHLPLLGEYLNQTIKTGETCTYHPLVEKPLDWKF